jgi:probable HAF family extracellular repeat protein
MRAGIVFACVLYLCNVLSGAAIYGVTDLGRLSGASSTAQGINAVGQVAGRGRTLGNQAFAFVWDGVASLVADNAIADDINESGSVVGTAFSSDGARATVWSSTGATMVSEGTQSFGTAINAQGDIAGNLTRDGQTRAFLLTDAGLQVLSTPGGWASAYDVNNSQQVVGYYQSEGRFRAFSWTVSTGTRTLGTLGGSASYAMAVNEAGTITGSAANSHGYLHAYLYDDTRMRDLGTLGGTSSYGYDVNLTGNAVGYSYDAQGRSRAFVWRDGQLFDLNLLIDPASGWSLEAAYGINDRGQIVGAGTYNGARTAFLLNPFAAPGSGPIIDGPELLLDDNGVPEPATAIAVLGWLTALGWYYAVRRRSA